MFKRLSTIQKFKNTGRRLLILVLQYYITMYIHSHTKCITPHFKKNLPRTFKKLNLFNRNVNARHTTMGGYQLRKATRVTQVTNKWKYGQENSLSQNSELSNHLYLFEVNWLWFWSYRKRTYRKKNLCKKSNDKKLIFF